MPAHEQVVERFARRLVDAIEAGLNRTAIDIYREWRGWIAHVEPGPALTGELHAAMRSMLGRDGAVCRTPTSAISDVGARPAAARPHGGERSS